MIIEQALKNGTVLPDPKLIEETRHLVERTLEDTI